MGWERGRYYTRSRREAGRVVREYVGAGPVGALAADLDALGRADRARERQAERALKAELAAGDAPLAELDAAADLLARAALLVAGYRQHNRGEWRKRRAQSSEGR